MLSCRKKNIYTAKYYIQDIYFLFEGLSWKFFVYLFFFGVGWTRAIYPNQFILGQS